MKTLILNGSPRRNGDTKSLLKELFKELEGEYRIVDAYYSGIKPCVDCRWCWKHEGCCVKDEMQEIYPFIQECDNILLASPIYFDEITGELLSVASRLQTYFSSKYLRKEIPVQKSKRGAVILVGGSKGGIERPFDTASSILRLMNAVDIHPVVYSLYTDQQPAIDNRLVLEGIKDIADFFNRTDAAIS
jgi:multimeric flavodoxin WrbA